MQAEGRVYFGNFGGISGEFRKNALVRFSVKIGRVATRLEKSSLCHPPTCSGSARDPASPRFACRCLKALQARWTTEFMPKNFGNFLEIQPKFQPKFVLPGGMPERGRAVAQSVLKAVGLATVMSAAAPRLKRK